MYGRRESNPDKYTNSPYCYRYRTHNLPPCLLSYYFIRSIGFALYRRPVVVGLYKQARKIIFSGSLSPCLPNYYGGFFATFVPGYTCIPWAPYRPGTRLAICYFPVLKTCHGPQFVLLSLPRLLSPGVMGSLRFTATAKGSIFFPYLCSVGL